MLELQHIFKTYEGKPLLRDISFKVRSAETACLLGASGSGKSTLLRIIAGLEDPYSGHVSFDGQELTDVAAHLRDFGLVFQDYALFPHLNVFNNIAFGLRMRRLVPAEIMKRVASSLAMVNLAGFDEREVTGLSGGEQQRVALARALATRPRLLMFDEPLGALDRTLREELLDELRGILHETKIPAIYVTHDQEEAFAVADRILILHEGQIVRAGTPAEVWDTPGSAFVAGFLGLGNIIHGEFLDSHHAVTPLGRFVVQCEHGHRRGNSAHFLARPLPAESEANIIQGVVKEIIFQKDRYKIILDHGFYVYLKYAPQVGRKIEVPVKVECLG